MKKLQNKVMTNVQKDNEWDNMFKELDKTSTIKTTNIKQEPIQPQVRGNYRGLMDWDMVEFERWANDLLSRRK